MGTIIMKPIGITNNPPTVGLWKKIIWIIGTIENPTKKQPASIIGIVVIIYRKALPFFN